MVWGIMALVGFFLTLPVVSWAERGYDRSGSRWTLAGIVVAVTLISMAMCAVENP